MRIFAVYDKKVSAFDKPFAMKYAGLAIRGFETMVNDRQNPTQLTEYPEDFTLYEIGVYDEIKGHIKAHKDNIDLGNGSSFKNSSPGEIQGNNQDTPNHNRPVDINNGVSRSQNQQNGSPTQGQQIAGDIR